MNREPIYKRMREMMDLNVPFIGYVHDRGYLLTATEREYNEWQYKVKVDGKTYTRTGKAAAQDLMDNLDIAQKKYTFDRKLIPYRWKMPSTSRKEFEKTFHRMFRDWHIHRLTTFTFDGTTTLQQEGVPIEV